MRKSFLLMAMTIGVALMAVSCAPEPIYSYPPEYYRSESGYKLYFTTDDSETLTVNNQNNVKRITQCKAGDTITVFLPVITPGIRLYRTEYRWTSNSEKLGPVTIKDDKDPCSEKYPPKWTFVAPDSVGSYTIYFRATYGYSGSAPDGSLSQYGGFPTNSGIHGYEDKSSVNGILKVIE